MPKIKVLGPSAMATYLRSANRFKNFSLSIPDINRQWNSARQGMRGAGQTGVISPEGHFHPI